MHDVCVRTVQTYGSAVWGPEYLDSDPARVARNDMEAGHFEVHEAMVPFPTECACLGN